MLITVSVNAQAGLSLCCLHVTKSGFLTIRLYSQIQKKCQTFMDPDQTQHFVRSDLGTNPLQKLSADTVSCH